MPISPISNPISIPTITHHNQKKTPPPISKDSIAFQQSDHSIPALFSKMTFPIRYLLCFGSRYWLGFLLLRPFEFVYRKCMQLFDTTLYAIAKRYEIPQLQIPKERLDHMKKLYWRLGKNKWKEGVESKFHKYGWAVFDLGLHKGSIEPGFNRNWERAVHFLSTQFQQRADAKMYLQLHKISCAHFMEKLTNTCVSTKIGHFRGEDQQHSCSFSSFPSTEASKDLEELNAEIQKKFGVQVAKFVQKKEGSFKIQYFKIPEKKIELILNDFSINLYSELENAKNKRDKFIAICKFFRNCEWLHPPGDGSSRCNLMLFNFLLTQNGFHPTLMGSYFKVNILPFEDFLTYAQKGLQTWERAS